MDVTLAYVLGLVLGFAFARCWAARRSVRLFYRRLFQPKGL
jgi:hypothetical protein